MYIFFTDPLNDIESSPGSPSPRQSSTADLLFSARISYKNQPGALANKSVVYGLFIIEEEEGEK